VRLGVRSDLSRAGICGGLWGTSNSAEATSVATNACAAVEKIHFEGMHYRRDIGQKGLKRWP
jgi:phosphoribosylamine-glycine ligase